MGEAWPWRVSDGRTLPSAAGGGGGQSLPESCTRASACPRCCPPQVHTLLIVGDTAQDPRWGVYRRPACPLCTTLHCWGLTAVRCTLCRPAALLAGSTAWPVWPRTHTSASTRVGSRRWCGVVCTCAWCVGEAGQCTA